jgi:hypothetical protein
MISFNKVSGYLISNLNLSEYDGRGKIKYPADIFGVDWPVESSIRLPCDALAPTLIKMEPILTPSVVNHVKGD